MFYGIRVNSALARLGIPPALIEKHLRRYLQQVGEASGNTPQEAAVFIAAELPMIHRMALCCSTVDRDWQAQSQAR
ncbi:hypothetical protein IVB44_21375 [Bradyrhizobium sp. 49]|uniref:hypothetical protein n=1 Tax=unclassified Bradyrhizobium TaxID=2631580 RepID=UPI001FFAEF84|nr:MULTISPECIES: hypothetical protein [unclassified Bradyrhizobium]MCK1266761.1 hypothetical protein [Bradyrhizobium sp. 84]MCK1373520.1 hypothetical protein [Bradyrhizobium sp. 49]